MNFLKNNISHNSFFISIECVEKRSQYIELIKKMLSTLRRSFNIRGAFCPSSSLTLGACINNFLTNLEEVMNCFAKELDVMLSQNKHFDSVNFIKILLEGEMT